MDKQEKRFAFMMPQGTLVLKDDLYIKNQGKTAEEGGQVFYAINLALELAKLGHEVDIYSRISIKASTARRIVPALRN